MTFIGRNEIGLESENGQEAADSSDLEGNNALTKTVAQMHSSPNMVTQNIMNVRFIGDTRINQDPKQAKKTKEQYSRNLSG